METEKRFAMIEASVQAVANFGFHGASVSVIADRAGIAAGTVYVHFKSKELERRCLEAIMKGYPSQGTIRQRFSHLVDGLIRHFMLFPEEFLFMDQFLSSPFRKAASPHYLPDAKLSGILQFFREGVEMHVFKEMPPAMLLAFACGPLIQVVRANTSGHLYLDGKRIYQAVEACWEIISLQDMPHL